MPKNNAKGSDGFEPPKYLASLIAAINDGAKAAQGGALLFALVGLYLLATAFSASDEDLLRGRTVTISQIGATLPVSFSFAIAPIVFVFLHIYTLARYYMLATNVRQFLEELDRTVPLETDRERCRQLLANVEFIQALVAPRGSRLYSWVWRWLVRAVIAGFPVLVLLLVQINALRYQSALITRVQQLALLVDLSALFWFSHRNPLKRPELQPRSRSMRTWRWACLLGLPATVLGLNVVYLSLVPAGADPNLVRASEVHLAHAASHPLDAVLCPSLQWGCRYLRVDHRTLVDHVWDDKAIVELRSGSSEKAKALAAIEGLVLRDRSLRFAALDESSLFAADLTGADLRKASLDNAGLSGAKLAMARLEGVTLSNAQLQGANLSNAQLQGANLDGAQLQGATLSGAQLQGAALAFAQLQGADLARAEFQGAQLANAQLQGAVFGEAHLEGAWLDYAQLQGAWFDGNQLQGASLDHVQLQGALLNHIFGWRADVRNANGEGARVISPETGPKYRSSNCPEPCDWSRGSFAALKHLIEQQVPKGGRRDTALKRIAPLDPAKPLPGEEASTKAWADLARSSLSLDDYEQDLAKWLRATSCDARAAPFVIRQLLPHLRYRFRSSSSQPAALAAAFLDEAHCPGARGLSDEEKFQLQMLRDQAAPAPALTMPK